MYTLIIIFAVSLIGILVILFRKAYQIEQGYVEPSLSKREFIAPSTIVSIRQITWRFSKENTHKALLWVTKWWAVITHLISKFIREKIWKEETIEGSPALSSFLKHVSEYKTRIRKIRQRLEAHDRAREIIEAEIQKNQPDNETIENQ